MAERRMFAKTIVDSDAFLDMPASSQLLYFHLSIRADDDGFINNPKSIMRNVGCKDDDMRLLVTKKFVIPFETGIVVIKHWKIHNYIQKDRYRETKYKNEKSLLTLDENNSYKLLGNGMYPECIQDVSALDTQVRLGKDSIELDTISPTSSGESVSIEDVFDKTYAIYPRKEGKTKGRQAYVSYLKKGRNVGGKKIRLNHQQIYFAVQAYAADVEGKDKQYIQHFDTFMNSTVVDYVEQTKPDYEAWMQEQHGKDWEKIKFEYRG